jgi:hypothetical protein
MEIAELTMATKQMRNAERSQGAGSRLFSGGKMARVLAKLGVDFERFVTEYDQDDTRTPRAAGLSEEDRAAVARFLKHREIRQLASELGCSVPSAHARVARFALERHPSV